MMMVMLSFTMLIKAGRYSPYSMLDYLKFQVIDEENREAALTGYYEALGVEEYFWGYQIPSDTIVVPSVVTIDGKEYTVTEIADNALVALGGSSNEQRYESFFPVIRLPETIRRIGKGALLVNAIAPCTNVNLPHSLEELDDQCLLTGAAAGDYILYENVNSIGKNVFTGMLWSVMFMNHDFEVNGKMIDIEYIGNLCFLGENLSIAPNTFNNLYGVTKLEFGKYPCDIASNAFSGTPYIENNGTEKVIQKVLVHCPEAYDIPDDAFSSCIYQNAVLHVPKSAVESYKSASGWKNFVNIEGFYDGDVNVDGTVTSSDVTALYDNLLDGDMENIMTGDVNGDGYTTSSDVSQVYDIILNSEPSTPPIEILEVDSIQTYTVNGVSFNMIGVKGGTFMMGAEDNAPYYMNNAKPAHQVTLSSYYIGQTEVTQELWEAVMGNNPSYWIGANLPVGMTRVSSCMEFISKLNQMTGESFRMPTEAEWEYAARGGNKSQGFLYSGSDNADEVAWHKNNNQNVYAHPVASKQPNELGIYDMSGNFYEWVSDRYEEYGPEPQINPTGSKTSKIRILRGGQSATDPLSCAVVCRQAIHPIYGPGGAGTVDPDDYYDDWWAGFRIVKDVPFSK